MKRMDAESTNAALCETFKTWGLPKAIQSDNGPPFRSTAFCEFWLEKGVQVRKSVPLSPQSNGMVERHNQGIIKALAASKLDGTNWRLTLDHYVHKHNTLVPHARLNLTPFELMVGWRYRGTFPCLWNQKPVDRTEVRERDAEAKLASNKYADTRRGARVSDVKVGDKVLLARQKRSKTDPTFSSEVYKVIARQGARVVVMNRNGVQYDRNIQEIRKVPLHDPELETSTEHSTAATPRLIDGKPVLYSENREPSHERVDSETEPTGLCEPDKHNLRSRQSIKRLAKFNDAYVYHVSW
ncbi:uncharacterized protein K02A2.6-like [Uranotaenia lowii]|uniref:uncharacterized protein K02A2.6-like n=1 Tax=Uranotaenia lowii TaxID=190385 RepID=UPI00247978F6|nr:uncharacterized protein K02A2.6-like [Uranotaenia lowii]